MKNPARPIGQGPGLAGHALLVAANWSRPTGRGALVAADWSQSRTGRGRLVARDNWSRPTGREIGKFISRNHTQNFLLFANFFLILSVHSNY